MIFGIIHTRKLECSLKFLSAFRTAMDTVFQYIDSNSDSVVFTTEQVSNRDVYPETFLYKVDSDAYVYDSTGERIGKFRTFGVNNWAYYGEDGSVAYNLGYDLIKAERLIVERLIALMKDES